MKKKLKDQIITELYSEVPGGLNLSALIKKIKFSSKKDIHKLKAELAFLQKNNIINIQKSVYRLSLPNEIFKGEISRLFLGYGIITDLETGKEFFVRGKNLLGGIPGDIVIAKAIENSSAYKRANPSSKDKEVNLKDGDSPSAKVIALVSESERTLTGIVVEEDGFLRLLPDSFTCRSLAIRKWNNTHPKNKDRVKFIIAQRGEKHKEHIVDIISVYGSGDIARVSVAAYLEEKNIPVEFPLAVQNEAKLVSEKGIRPHEIKNRLDLRDKVIFTIDGADTKDIDDAVSIEKNNKGFSLGVHIADVSHYVKMNGDLDKEALRRGNSVYIADLVVPMLPPELSNGICSLNPKEDRLAFSCLMELSEEGEILKSEFKKTVIHSRIQGVYKEINDIILNKADQNIIDKYSGISDKIPLMVTLANILKKQREKRGALNLQSDESKIICGINGKCVDIKKREPGIAEGIIEEFMLAANNSAAKTAMENHLPFVYRIHESPLMDKLQTLSEALEFLGINGVIGKSGKVSDLAKVLNAVENSEKAGIVNTLVLRTMAKARYSEEPLGHYGLVTDEYAHFTSPIRRYSDLAIHRILSDFSIGAKNDRLLRKYFKYSVSAAARASSTELLAISAERDCNKYYMAEFMSDRKDEEFDAIISGVTINGFFVRLPNTVEGRVDVITLPDGEYEVEQNLALKEKLSGKKYTLGDKVRVKCAAVSVAAGLIDFQLIDD